jgi:hypothetical protein
MISCSCRTRGSSHKFSQPRVGHEERAAAQLGGLAVGPDGERGGRRARGLGRGRGLCRGRCRGRFRGLGSLGALNVRRLRSRHLAQGHISGRLAHRFHSPSHTAPDAELSGQGSKSRGLWLGAWGLGLSTFDRRPRPWAFAISPGTSQSPRSKVESRQSCACRKATYTHPPRDRHRGQAPVTVPGTDTGDRHRCLSPVTSLGRDIDCSPGASSLVTKMFLTDCRYYILCAHVANSENRHPGHAPPRRSARRALRGPVPLRR